MVIGSIGAAECRAGETRDELGTLIAGARREYDLPANIRRSVSGGQGNLSRVIIHKQKE
jgi:hypothetical protein